MVQFGDCTGGTKTKAGNERGGGECVLYPWSTRQYNLTQKLDFKQRFPKHKVQKKECFLQRQPFHLCSGFSYLSTFITTFYHSLHSPTSSLSPSLINFFFFCFTPPDCLQTKLFFFFVFVFVLITKKLSVNWLLSPCLVIVIPSLPLSLPQNCLQVLSHTMLFLSSFASCQLSILLHMTFTFTPLG